LGILGRELAWFKSYLTNRKQFVAINDVESELLSILVGVPQGLILSPILFLLYINDLPNYSSLLSLLFADDTALAAENDDINSLVQFVNTEFRKICNYFRLHKLSLHPDKTKFMLISNAKNSPAVSIFINNNNLNQNDPNKIFQLSQVFASDPIPAIKYLGVYFDPQLNFKYHINYVSKENFSSFVLNKNCKKFSACTHLKNTIFFFYSLSSCICS
jgi:hypothetical protein